MVRFFLFFVVSAGIIQGFFSLPTFLGLIIAFVSSLILGIFFEYALPFFMALILKSESSICETISPNPYTPIPQSRKVLAFIGSLIFSILLFCFFWWSVPYVMKFQWHHWQDWRIWALFFVYVAFLYEIVHPLVTTLVLVITIPIISMIRSSLMTCSSVKNIWLMTPIIFMGICSLTIPFFFISHHCLLTWLVAIVTDGIILDTFNMFRVGVVSGSVYENKTI